MEPEEVQRLGDEIERIALQYEDQREQAIKQRDAGLEKNNTPTTSAS